MKYEVHQVITLPEDLMAALEEQGEKAKIAEGYVKMGEILEIPVRSSNYAHGAFILMEDFVDIISDENRLKEIVSKLKNKAFW